MQTLLYIITKDKKTVNGTAFRLHVRLCCDKICYEKVCAMNGRRWCALCGGTVTLRWHRNPQGNLRKEGVDAMTILELLAVLGYTATIFAVGYTLGLSANKQKWPPRPEIVRSFWTKQYGLTVYRQRLFFVFIIMFSFSVCQRQTKKPPLREVSLFVRQLTICRTMIWIPRLMWV